MNNVADPLVAAGIRCYETFRDGSIAFERGAELYFGPREKLSAFLSGSSESFLSGEEAEARIAQLRKRAGDRPIRSTPPVSADNDGLATTRRRWESERGQWPVGISHVSARELREPSIE
jgi:hypothetical protein